MRKRSGSARLVVLLLVMAVLGCIAVVVYSVRDTRTGNYDAVAVVPNPLPATPSPPVVAPAPADETATPVALPDPCFQFLKSIDRQALAARMDAASVQAVAVARPDGMDDDVFELCRLISDGDASPHSLCTLRSVDTGTIKDASFSSDGELFVTLSDKLKIWRAEDGQLVREHALPATDVQQLLLGNDPDSATLVSDDEIIKLSLADGSVTARCQMAEGILNARQAAEAGHVAVCLKNKQLMLVSKDLKSRIVCPEIELASHHIAVHPTGKHVLGNHTKGMMRWQVKPSNVEFLGDRSFDPQTAIPVCGPTYDRWVGKHLLHEFRGSERTEPIIEGPGRPFVINTPVLHAFSCSSELSGDSLLVFTGGKSASDPDLRILDLYPFRYAASMPAVVGQDQTAKVYASSRGNRLAIQSGGEMRLLERRAWVEYTGEMFPSLMTDLFADRRFEQLELIGQYVRSFPKLPCGESGEKLYRDMVHHLASFHLASESDPERAQWISAVDGWVERGSELALTVSARRHRFRGGMARGGGFASEVSEEGWDEFHKRNLQALSDLSRLGDSEDRPAVVYEMLVDLTRDINGEYSDAEQFLKDYTLRYPLEINAHLTACFWSLPRWGGEPLQLAAYVQSLSELYPADWTDRIYARLAANIYGTLRELQPGEFALDLPRAIQGMRSLVDSGEVTIEDLERCMILAKQSENEIANRLIVERMAAYHVAHFDFPCGRAYYDGVTNDLIRFRAIAQYREKPNGQPPSDDAASNVVPDAAVQRP